MAGFEFRSVRALFGAKPINALIAVLLLSSTVSCRNVKTDVMKITEDLPKDETDLPKTAAIPAVHDPVLGEFFDIILKLANEATEEMQADQASSGAGQSDKNETRNEKTTNSIENDPIHQWKRQMALENFQQKILEFTGRQDAPRDPGVSPPDTSMFPEFPEVLPIMPGLAPNALYTREALSPICPIKDEENITVMFNISEPKASSKNKILSVVSAELKLWKTPLKVDNSTKYQDDAAAAKWRETFQKADINASEEVINTKVNEQRMLQVTVYKIRNKINKTSELKKLDTQMISASFKGITTLNVTKAITVWGNDTNRTLSLVIVVEDERGNKMDARSIFKMQCENNFYRPMPMDQFVKITNKSYTAWLNLATEELPAKVVAYNAAAKSANRLMHEQAASR